MHRSLSIAMLWVLAVCNGSSVQAQDSPAFRAGVGRREITPPPGLPMWGYAARHDALATGSLDPLIATAVVIEAGGEKLAIVATDLGRGPTPEMLEAIRKEVAEKAGIRHVLISGSHTHNGPVLELNEKPGRGAAKFAPAIAYAKRLPLLLTEAILEADQALRPAKIGVGREEATYNRNRQAKQRPKVTDTSLWVLRLDDLENKPIAILVNYAAHPTMTDSKILKYSADFPGYLRTKVEADLGAPCLFLQGAAGDLSTSGPAGTPPGPKGFGESLGLRAADLAKKTSTSVPKTPSIKSSFTVVPFATRIDLKNPLVQTLYGRAFFPELIAAAGDEHGQGVKVQLATVLLNQEIALVGASGEFFCEHANRLRSRLDLKSVLFLGYCNGHHFYFPTIEAAAEGGYGAEPGVSLAELGAGERLMNQALLSIYRLMGKIPVEGK